MVNCPCAVPSYYVVYVVPFMVRKAPYSVILSYYVVCMVSFVMRMAPYSEVELPLLVERDLEYLMDRGGRYSYKVGSCT